ncbi:MAG: hypothetical protein C4547_00715 [Phycisphaerales bacterium]|nr:MAG: hypothetical protein C4547_00715 [Phycisphaerales bacterium]
MTLQIPLSPEAEVRLREQATAAGKDLATFVLEVVEERVAGTNGLNTPALSPQQWSREWHEWAASHRRLDRAVDDSRESIYAGRGE